MVKVKAVPAGFHTVTPFLNVKGAAEAIEFYKQAFGAEERSRTPGPGGMVMHAEIKIGDSIVMLSDAMRHPPTQSSMHLYVEDCDAVWKRATDAGCKVEQPIQDQFWGDRHGVVSDRWGNHWGISSHKEDLSQPEMEKRMAEAMKQTKK